MLTEIYGLLGKRRIGVIYRIYHLKPEDKKIVERIIEKWGNLEIGEGIVPIATRIIGQNPRSKDILCAALKIKLDYRQEKLYLEVAQRRNGHRPNSSLP